MDEIAVHVETEINPTESEDKVRKAVENTFGNIPITIKPLKRGSLLVAEGNGLEFLTKLCNMLARERIRAAARAVLMEGIEKKAVNFCLNKQVAYVGHISFSGETAESPLGPIKVRICCSDPHELVKWLTSRTI